MIRKISEPPIEVRNYWLEGHIEKETGKSVDGTDDVWQFDQRMKIVEPLIRETAEFGVEICDPERRPSILSEGEVALECIEGRYDLLDARYWVFSHLYGHAICQANSIYSLFSHSYVSQGFQLWRSLFEAHVICEFLSRHLSNSILFQDYIAHTLLRSWIRTQKGANAICKKNGQQPRYDISEIAKCEKLYRSKSWKMGEEYAWANSVVQRKSEKQRIVFRYFLDQVDSDMSELYRISSMELHSTLGQRFALLGKCLPLPSIPIALFGIVNREELELDFLASTILHRLTCRADEFIFLDDCMSDHLNSLTVRGNDILEERKRSNKPVMQDRG